MSKLDAIAGDAIKFEVERALRTLKEAEEIKQDEKLMGEVKKLMNREKGLIKSLEDLKFARDKAYEKEDKKDVKERQKMMKDMMDEHHEEMEEEDEKEVSNEKPDPLLEENTYIKRLERANADNDKPDATVVKLQED